jgi:hypothetical protein
LALNTVIHRIAVLSKAHQVHAATNPCAQPSVRELLSKQPARLRQARRTCICDASSTGLRDRALLLFAFASDRRRRSEVCVATMENTRRQRDGLAFTPSYSKTNQAGADRPETDKPIVGKAVHALTARLAAWKIKSGPIFRRVRRGSVVGEPLSPAAVRDIVKGRHLRQQAAVGLPTRLRA